MAENLELEKSLADSMSAYNRLMVYFFLLNLPNYRKNADYQVFCNWWKKSVNYNSKMKKSFRTIITNIPSRVTLTITYIIISLLWASKLTGMQHLHL
jgi:hypothetical protein